MADDELTADQIAAHIARMESVEERMQRDDPDGGIHQTPEQRPSGRVRVVKYMEAGTAKTVFLALNDEQYSKLIDSQRLEQFEEHVLHRVSGHDPSAEDNATAEAALRAP